MVLIKMSPESVVNLAMVIFPAAIADKRFREAQSTIYRPRPRPAVRLTIAGYQRVIDDMYIGPHILVFIVVNTAHQIEDDMRLVAGRERILMKAYPRRRRKF